ncbi:MAG TPA: DNA alkylation repair protein [Candidatus Absconditabacterales bacterium]|nr:DNA alkylation repair protein [Candidatus Absconditabacterales bacterium]
MYSQIKKELLALQNSEKAGILQGFFKTGKGEYGEGDVFLGITMPQQRQVVKKYFKEISFDDIQKLLESKYHEFRMSGLLCLVYKYEFEKDETREKNIFDFYVKNLEYVNNWDLVDVTCPKIIGDYLLDKEKDILYNFAKSENMWIQRVAIVSTWTLIKNGQLKDTIKLAEILLDHEHDLIHKAVGWMLRELGKKDKCLLEKFLEKNVKLMPRTMLRYSIERFGDQERKFWLNK